MSDDEDMSDTDQPPALEDADIEDVSSGASVVTESSASVSIDTDNEGRAPSGRRPRNNIDALLPDDDESDESSVESGESYSGLEANGGGLGPAFIVPLKTGSDDDDEDDDDDDDDDDDKLPGRAVPTGRARRRRSVDERNDALERNSLRRQASNEMLAAMRAAAQSAASHPPQHADHAPRRAPPQRTKSGDLVNGGSGDHGVPVRRPPPRTKSGEDVGGSTAPPRRRPPARTKSGDGMIAAESAAAPVRREPSGPGNLGEPSDSGDFVVPLRADSDEEENFLMSPSGRRRRTVQEKEQALSRNAVRRQASSDMLRAMRDATVTRAPPDRAKSSAAALQRRPPPRTTSGEVIDGVDGPKRPEPRRRPPPRTKSGDGLGEEENGRAPPRRRPPARTVSAGVFNPPTVVEE